MKLDAELRLDLPRLAWCAAMELGSTSIRLVHGPWVEVDETSFVEGVWNGDFGEKDFVDSECSFGSGGRLQDGAVCFASASDPLLKLYSIRVGERLFVSNSIAFVLEAAGESLDIGYISYQTDLQKLVSCCACHVGNIPLLSGREMTVVHFRNLWVSPDLTVRFVAKPLPKPWNTYKEYEIYLLSSLRGLAINGQDPRRCQTYKLLGQLSSGYDSSACTALARDAGCTEAISFLSPRKERDADEQLSDDGEAVARALGLKLLAYETLAYTERSDMVEAEFMACGELGQEVYLSSGENALAGTVLIAGHHGDHVWDRNPPNIRTDLPRKSSSGCSLNEFRLRVGFIHVPLPMLGAVHHPSLFQITRSPEMGPWTLGTSYDRPIARRLVEERGVERGAFAVQKKAASVLLNTETSMSLQMSKRSWSDFEEFYNRYVHHRNHGDQRLYDVMYAVYSGYRKVARVFRFHGILTRLGLPGDLLCPVPKRFRENPGKPSFLVHWGLSKIAVRYKDKLDTRCWSDRQLPANCVKVNRCG